MFFLLISVTFAVSSVIGFRTSVCVERNEEFSLCSWRCPPTCVNIRLLTQHGISCPYKWECVVGCRCSPGYIRDEYSRRCLPVWQCPGVLIKSQVSSTVNRRACMKGLMKVDEAKEVCQDRRKWKFVSLPTPTGKKRDFMNVLNVIIRLFRPERTQGLSRL